MLRKAFLTLAGFAWAAGAAVTLAQDKARTLPAGTPAFGEEIDVRVVNLEVVVTDRQGNRVKDLKPGDFRLLIDGRPVPIEYFTAVSEGRAVAPAPAAAAGETEPAAAVPSVGPGEAVGVNYLVFVDDFFAIARQRDDVLASLRRDLSRLGPADRMSVVAWDGGRLARLADWTGSRAELAQAFGRAMQRPARGPERRMDHINFIESQQLQKGVAEDTASLLSGSSGIAREGLNPGLNPLELAYGEVLARQIRSAVAGVVGAMRGSAAPSGRKVLLLLSGGWPYSLASYIRGSGSVPLSRELPEGEKLLRPLTRAANLLGYTVYPVDVPGVSSVAADASQNYFEDEQQESMVRGAGSTGKGSARGDNAFVKAPAGPAPQPARLTDTGSFQEQELEGSLQFIAQETGGKAILNTNRVLALASAAEDTRSYYWIGFAPSWRQDDKAHDVKVEALRPGLRVRSRGSFVDLSRQAQVAMRLESALMFGSVPGTAPLGVRLGAPVRARGRGKGLEIPVLLAIPTSALTAVPIDGKYTAQLQLRFAASDDQGNLSDIPGLQLKLASSKPPADGQYVRYDTRITLNGKARHLVAAVYDPLSGKISTGEVDLPVP
jgi:VWFA-related protein